MHADLLQEIRPGMKVVDATNSEIGTVEGVKYGDDDPSTPEPEAAGISPSEERERGGSLLHTIADALSADELPEEVRERLLHQGFVRIDADGLFNADRYITPDQIAGVADGRLRLKVTKSDLLREP